MIFFVLIWWIINEFEKKLSKRKKDSISFDKDRADVLAASDRGSYFEQKKYCSRRGGALIGRTRPLVLVLSGRKLKAKAKTNLQNRTHKSLGKSWPVEQLLPEIACKKISWNQFLVSFLTQMWFC